MLMAVNIAVQSAAAGGGGPWGMSKRQALPLCPEDRVVMSVGAVLLIASGVFVTESFDAMHAGAELISTSFTAAEAPVPSNAGANPMATLNGATCPNSANSCYAVGSFNDSSGHQQALIESLSGFVWTPSTALLPSNANCIRKPN